MKKCSTLLIREVKVRHNDVSPDIYEMICKTNKKVLVKTYWYPGQLLYKAASRIPKD